MKEEMLKLMLFLGPTDKEKQEVADFNNAYLAKLEEALGEKVSVVTPEEAKGDEFPVFFISTGGAEEEFQEVYKNFPEPYILLTTEAFNSLAAAMEIMGYLDMDGKKGEILHGEIEEVAQRIKVLRRVTKAQRTLKTKRLGAIGKPSGLISSEADGEKLRNASGMQIIDIDLNELIEEYKVCGVEENEYTKAIREKNYDNEEIEKALRVYTATKHLIKKYDLDAVTVKCFGLLDTIETTGCLALAILNTEGIPAACEGDTKSLISMTILHELTDEPVFMANPCFMNTKQNEMIFAHCTLPISMPNSYELTTHMESGIGVAIAADVDLGPVTVFKCDDALSRYYAGEGKLVECLHRDDLCRTQMRIEFTDGVEYFLKNPISNHHLICKGAWKDVIDEFFLG